MSGGHVRLRVVTGRLLLLCAAGCLIVSAGGILFAPPAQASASDDRKLGAALFRDKGCEHCHGIDGTGTQRAPDLSGVGRIRRKPDIERQIRDGGKEMPAFGDTLSNDEVQQLVAYLAAKKKKGTKLAEWPPSSSKKT